MRTLRPSARTPRRLRAATALAVFTLVAGVLGGCAQDEEPADATASGGSSGGSSGGGGSDEDAVTVSVGVFGVFGYKQAGLYDEYTKLNPHVRIKETSIERNEQYYSQLLTHLAANSGLSDIQAVEVGNINEVTTTQAGRFVDLGKADGVRKADYLSWKWDQATDEDGRTIGLGTDIGPMGICYRKDLFAKAGLPTDRTAVGALWAGDWQKYVDTGRRYTRRAPAGTSYMDGAAGVYNGVISSSRIRNYSEDGELIFKTSPSVKASWDLAMQAAEGGMTAKFKQFTKEWDQGYANARFATVICPSWMLGYIKEKSGTKGEDQWDIAPAPKPANWGGSFLTVPERAKHKDEAVKLATWLTAPAQQAKLFARQASFPSAQTAISSPGVSGAKHPYFGDAPIGRIFSDAARNMPTLVLGPKDQPIGQQVSDVGILQVEQQGKSPDEGWRATLKAVDNALDQ